MTLWRAWEFILSLAIALVPAVVEAGPDAAKDPSVHLQIVESTTSSLHPRLGPANAPVVIELFVDLNNPRTGPALSVVRELATRHPTRLRIDIRLTEKREHSSNLAQVLGMEAWKQGQFFPFLDAFYKGRRRPPSFKEYQEVAKDSGIDYELVRLAMESSSHAKTLADNHNRWRRFGVRQLPGLAVNGQPLPMTSSLKELEEIYDNAYQQSLSMQRRGVPRDAVFQRLAQKSVDTTLLKRGNLRGHVGSLDLAPDESLPDGPQPVKMGPLLQGTHRRGPDDAPIKAVFMCHLRSSMCRTMFGYLDILGRLYPKEFQLTFLPLFFSDRPGQDNSREMYEAVLCADEQQSFWEYIGLVYEQRVRVNFDMEYAAKLASTLRLDSDRFASCIKGGRQKAQLNRELALSLQSGARHTPSLAIGGVLYHGRLYTNELQLLVESLKKPGLLETLSAP